MTCHLHHGRSRIGELPLGSAARKAWLYMVSQVYTITLASVGGLCEVARPLEEAFDAIEKGALCSEGRPVGTKSGMYREGCIPAPAGPRGWLGALSEH